MEADLMTAQDAAKFLGLKPDTLYRWRKDGKGPPYYRVGSGRRARIRYSREDVERWIDEQHREVS